MLIRNLPTMLFLLIWLVPSIIVAASSHKHSQGKERLEDGAFSPRDHDHFNEEGSKEFYLATCYLSYLFNIFR